MTEAESESGTLLNNQQLDLQKMHSSRLLWQSAGDMLFSCSGIVTVQMETDQFSGH